MRANAKVRRHGLRALCGVRSDSRMQSTQGLMPPFESRIRRGLEGTALAGEGDVHRLERARHAATARFSLSC
ncbi:protein of unknown function [Pararobbsia alpina]